MRTMERNKSDVYYALYDSKTPITDDYGNETGEYTLTFKTPVYKRFNVSAARGTSELEQFGINTIYSKTIVTEDVNCPMTEGTRLWIGIKPTEIINGNSVSHPHNFVVTEVARSINSVMYAIKEVVVS